MAGQWDHGRGLQFLRFWAEFGYRARGLALAVLVDVPASVFSGRNGDPRAAGQVNPLSREGRSRLQKLAFNLGQIRLRVEEAWKELHALESALNPRFYNWRCDGC